MQNEELQKTEWELHDIQTRYFDLYQMASIGYLILSLTSQILETNLTAAALLGQQRGVLIKQNFSNLIFNEDQDSFYLHTVELFEKDDPQEYELRMVKKDGTVLWIQIAATAAKDNGESICRMVLSDITERKMMEFAL